VFLTQNNSQSQTVLEFKAEQANAVAAEFDAVALFLVN
jgi:hypothetical protein